LEHSIAPGLSVEEREFRRFDQGPFRAWILRVDPQLPSVNVLPLHAGEKAAGLETTNRMAERYGAIAAVNGGYFAFGAYAGISKNHFLYNGRILGTWKDRSALIFCREQAGRENLQVAPVEFRGQVLAGTSRFPLDGLNRERGDSELIWYTSDFPGSTRTRGGLEVTLDAQGKVLSITKDGNSPIPARGGVLSASGKAAVWLQAYAKPGARLRIEAKLLQTSCEATDIVSAGPLLIQNGEIDLSEKGFAHAAARHPRTAAGITRDGKLLFVVVDGRSQASAGMTIAELAQFLQELGAYQAVNLDGGGSSTFYAQGRIWNQPSDGRPRPVSDALLLFSIPDWPSLKAHLVHWRKDPTLLPEAAAARLLTLGNEGNFAAMRAGLATLPMSEFVRRVLDEALEALAYNRPHGLPARSR
jgi:hypothetical protein